MRQWHTNSPVPKTKQRAKVTRVLILKGHFPERKTVYCQFPGPSAISKLLLRLPRPHVVMFNRTGMPWEGWTATCIWAVQGPRPTCRACGRACLKLVHGAFASAHLPPTCQPLPAAHLLAAVPRPACGPGRAGMRSHPSLRCADEAARPPCTPIQTSLAAVSPLPLLPLPSFTRRTREAWRAAMNSARFTWYRALPVNIIR